MPSRDISRPKFPTSSHPPHRRRYAYRAFSSPRRSFSRLRFTFLLYSYPLSHSVRKNPDSPDTRRVGLAEDHPHISYYLNSIIRGPSISAASPVDSQEASTPIRITLSTPFEQETSAYGSPNLSTMSFLQDTTLLHSTKLSALNKNSKDGNGRQPLKSRSSVSALVEFVRNPVETIGDAVSVWYAGLTKEERERSEAVESRTRVLYLTLQNVCCHVPHPIINIRTNFPLGI